MQDGKVIDKPVFNIDRGGWTPFAAPFLSILAAYNGIPVNPNDLNALGQQLGKVYRWKLGTCSPIYRNCS